MNIATHHSDPQFHFDWSELAFASKKPLRSLQATFIAAPREISEQRFLQLIKQYLPTSPIIVGIAKEDYIDGFAGQPHFRTLKLEKIQHIFDKVNNSSSPHKLYSLSYFQREVDHIIEKLECKRVVLVNGSWLYAFHNRSTYYLLANNRITYDHVSPFTNEQEAKTYDAALASEIAASVRFPDIESSRAADASDNRKRKLFTAAEMLQLANQAATFSYDYCFQTGATLGRQRATSQKTANKKYEFLLYAYNAVVPYSTYALHHGSLREKHFSPPNDLNYYDTLHAEVELIIQAQKRQLELQDASLFINLLPCPTCARMLSKTDIAEIVYREDHSAGYAIGLLEQSGKRVRRLIND